MTLAPAPRQSARASHPLPQAADRTAASTSARRRSARGPAEQAVLPDEIWEDIFVRLDAAADLVRASAACSSFRRTVSERRFLRRFRSLRSPAVLGFIGSTRCRPFFPVEPPHRSAPEGRALKQAADFTFSFLPGPHTWDFCNARDGRVLLSRRISATTLFEDFVVCDPLHHRYVKIPRIPDELMAASTPAAPAQHVLPVLAPALENDEEEWFRIICTLQLQDKAMAFVFSSCNQTWRCIISTTSLPNGSIEYMPSYAHGCLHWTFYRMGYSLMLDTSEMKFSIIDLLPHNSDSMRTIVEAEEGRIGLVTIGDGTIDLHWKKWQSNDVGAQEWQQGKLIPLPKEINYRWSTIGSAGRYLALVACYGMHCKYFVLDIKTLLLEELCNVNNGPGLNGFPYARFPPPLALPSI